MRAAALFICRFDKVSTKTPAGFLADMDKLMLKFMQKCEALGMFKTILKKENKAGRSALPDFKTYYKVTVLETAVLTYGWKCTPTEPRNEGLLSRPISACQQLERYLSFS